MYTRKYKLDYCGGNNSCFRNSERINCPEKINRKVVFQDEILRRETAKDEKYKEVKIPIQFDSFPQHGIIKENPPAWQHLIPFEKEKDSDLRRDFRKKKYYSSEEEQEWNNFRDPVHAAILEAANNVTISYSSNRNLPGYGYERKPHPFYRTTSMSYGYYPQTERDHTINQITRTPRKCHLSGHLADTLFRNRSLNVSHN